MVLLQRQEWTPRPHVSSLAHLEPAPLVVHGCFWCPCIEIDCRRRFALRFVTLASRELIIYLFVLPCSQFGSVLVLNLYVLSSISISSRSVVALLSLCCRSVVALLSCLICSLLVRLLNTFQLPSSATDTVKHRLLYTLFAATQSGLLISRRKTHCTTTACAH